MAKYPEQKGVSAKDALALCAGAGSQVQKQVDRGAGGGGGYSRKHAISLVNGRGAPPLLKRSRPTPLYPPEDVHLVLKADFFPAPASIIAPGLRDTGVFIPTGSIDSLSPDSLPSRVRLCRKKTRGHFCPRV